VLATVFSVGNVKVEFIVIVREAMVIIQ